MTPVRSTVVDVDLDAIAANLRAARGDAEHAIAVVKADAYGHGAEAVSEALVEAGAEMLAVFTVEEGLVLRRAGIRAPILVFVGVTDASEVGPAVEADLTLGVWDEKRARAIASAASAQRKAARVHVKVDTGLTRLGAPLGEAADRYRAIKAITGLEIEGFYTHYATADSPGDTFTVEQVRRFADAVASLPEKPKYLHASASAGVALVGVTDPCNTVRPGLALYGLHAAPHLERAVSLRPALRWSSRVQRVARVPKDTGVGYGHDYKTSRDDSVIATVPVGYGDGLMRSARQADVLVRGNRVRIANRVAMDLFMIDVTDVPEVREQDEVVLIGTQQGETLSAEDLAASCGTINYEIVTNIRQRVARRYFRDGRHVATRTLRDGLVRS